MVFKETVDFARKVDANSRYRPKQKHTKPKL